MCTYFKTETEDHSTGRILSEKKYGDTGLVSEKTEALYAELNERVKVAIVVILQQTNFYNIFILCSWLRIIRRSDQGV